MNLYGISQTREIECLAIESGLSALLLMKRAGFRAFNSAQSWFPAVKRVYVLCGAGNNGGDGFAFAQYAHLAGWQVDVGLVVSPAQIKTSESVSLLSELAALSILPKPYDVQICAQADLIVDALLGIGLKAHLSADMTALIASINAFAKPVLALDIPSGLSADTGMSHGDAIVAKRTITFLTHKPGLVSADGPDFAGEVQVETLGVSEAIFEQVRPVSKLMHIEQTETGLEPRKKNVHKGMFGQALVVGGDMGMLGAVMLAGQACAHAGAGVVRVVTRAASAPWVTMKCPEVMAYGERQLVDFLERATVVAIGPGMSKNAWAKQLWQQVLLSDKPKIVDAGALRLLAEQPVHRDDWILTPHPGEAAALLGVTAEDVQKDRLAAVVALHEQFGGVIVLKGNGTLVYDGTEAHICDFGDGALSSAGMGDVLSGIITALVAQGASLVQAAIEGVMMHARAGESLAEGARVVVASELVEHISRHNLKG
jgi:NAD(P)H-hydrate epimerase